MTEQKKEVKGNRCIVLRGFCLKEGEFHQKWKKNEQNQYVLHNKTRERQPNIISLNDADMKKALKMKAIEVLD